MNIPTKLKLNKQIIIESLMWIWSMEVIENKKLPSQLKDAGVTPIFKKP